MLHSPSSSRTNIDANFAPTRWCYHHWHAPGQQQELGRGCGEGVWCIGWSRLDGDGWICGWTLCADVVCLQDISYDKFLKIIRKIEKDSKIQLIATSRHKFFFKAITVISTSSSNPITNHPHHPPGGSVVTRPPFSFRPSAGGERRRELLSRSDVLLVDSLAESLPGSLMGGRGGRCCSLGGWLSTKNNCLIHSWLLHINTHIYMGACIYNAIIMHIKTSTEVTKNIK